MCIKRKIRLSLQQLCILIIGILYLLTLSSCDSTEFKGNPFSGGLAENEHLCTSLALMEL